MARTYPFALPRPETRLRVPCAVLVPCLLGALLGCGGTSDPYYDRFPRSADGPGPIEPSKPVVAAVDRPPIRPTASQAAQPVAKRFAIVMGVSSYRDTRIPSLRYAASDAQAFHAWLTSPQGGRYAPANVKLLLDAQATAANMRDALFGWSRRAIAEDLLTIYFACHGSPESPDKKDNLYLLPYDTDYDRIAATGFPMWDIETAIKRFVQAQRVIVIADACHAGGVGSGFAGGFRDVKVVKTGLVNQALGDVGASLSENKSIGKGVAVFTASGNGQLSQEGKRWGSGRGVFTHFLLEGLRGGADYSQDGRVTLGELVPYLSQEVRRATQSGQCPEVAGKFDPAMAIGK